MNVINLAELTDHQLETALMVGEGFTQRVRILKRTGETKVIDSIIASDYEGNVFALPTKVKYSVLLEDKLNGNEDATIFVEMTRVGLSAQF